MTDRSDFVISRATADAAFAAEIAAMVESDGHRVLPVSPEAGDIDYVRSFNDAMARGARLIVLLSPAYLRGDRQAAEWQSVLARDPLNKTGALLILRIAECEPPPVLRAFAYHDLVRVRDDAGVVADILRQAIGRGASGETVLAGPYWRAPRTIVDPDAVREARNFTGREAELAKLESMLWRGSGTAAVCGCAGVGKSALAHEYARQNLARYAVVWQLAADTEAGIVDGLVRLGAELVPGLEATSNPLRAAQRVVTSLLTGLTKPVLLVFDGLEDDGVLHWRARGAHVLVTTLTANWGAEAEVLRLPVWSPHESIRYVRRQSGRTDVTDAAADAIGERLGHLPLALEHAATYLQRTKTVSARQYLERITDQRAAVPPAADYAQRVLEVFVTLIARAEREAPGAAALLCLAALCAAEAVPVGIFRQALTTVPDRLRPVFAGRTTAVADVRSTLADEARVEEAFGALDRLALVAYAPRTREFSVHPVVRAAARTLLVSESLWSSTAAALSAAATGPGPSTAP